MSIDALILFNSVSINSPLENSCLQAICYFVYRFGDKITVFAKQPEVKGWTNLPIQSDERSMGGGGSCARQLYLKRIPAWSRC